MDITILEPDKRFDQDDFAIYLEASEASFDGLCIGRGTTKVDAITAAQRELVQLTRRMSEMVWRENGGGQQAPCIEDQNPTER